MLAIAVVDALQEILQAERRRGKARAAHVRVVVGRRRLHPVRQPVHQFDLHILAVLDALALEDEEMSSLAQMLALGRRDFLLVYRAYLLDGQRVVALHAVVLRVQQVLLVDEHAAQVDGQCQSEVARVAVGLHVLDVAYLVALPMHGTEAAANLLVVEQQRVVGLVDVVGLEEIHVLIAAQLAETAEGHVAVVARQARYVLVGAYDHDVVRATAAVLLAAGSVVGIVGTVVGALHLHHQQALLLHLGLEDSVGHALRFGEHLLRVDAHHLLRRVNHIGDEDGELVRARLVEQLLEDGGKVGRRSVADALCGLEDIGVADELREALRIGINLGVDDVDAVVVARAGQLIQHTHDGSLERAVATGGVVGHHRARALQVEADAQRLATCLDVDFLRRAAALEEVFDVVFHFLNVQLAVLVEVLEVSLLTIQKLHNLLPLASVDHLVAVGHFQQQAVQFLPLAASAGCQQQAHQCCHHCRQSIFLHHLSQFFFFF